MQILKTVTVALRYVIKWIGMIFNGLPNIFSIPEWAIIGIVIIIIGVIAGKTYNKKRH